ncbi:hypothetical protein GCM10020229_06510 [Kitasatospora albolonga]|uniref:ABC transporter permease n=1 Tax=Kitasatospora albolonga TaxID=68173 RepID=UPI0031E5241B
MITLLALPFGLRVGPLNLLLAYLLLGLLALMTSAISYGIALVLPNDAAMAPGGQHPRPSPIALLSGTLLPLALAPVWLQTAAKWNPFYWAVEGHAVPVLRPPRGQCGLAGPGGGRGDDGRRGVVVGPAVLLPGAVALLTPKGAGSWDPAPFGVPTPGPGRSRPAGPRPRRSEPRSGR